MFSPIARLHDLWNTLIDDLSFEEVAIVGKGRETVSGEQFLPPTMIASYAPRPDGTYVTV